jgi:hypothetical protein
MSDDLVIQRATRAQVKLRIALMGVSGGGKTGSALLLAKGMVAELGRRGKLPDLPCHIGLLDTERDSASMYSHFVDFDSLPLAPPYTVDRYLDGLTMLIRAGYSVIVIDQITHEWHGEGGILSWVREIQASGGNEYTAWKKPSEAHDRFVDALLNCPTHLIVTMRSKTAHALEKNDKGKMVPKRIGLQARQRDGMEYEFTTLLDLAAGTNAATCHKDRTELFPVGEVVPRDSKPPHGSKSLGVGVGWGEKLIEWVYTATKPGAAAPHIEAEARCIAVADAGIRACERTGNVPDLNAAYLVQRNAIGAFQGDAGAEVVQREIERLQAACAKHKASFGVAGGVAQVAPSGGPISPDDCANLETLLSDAGVLAADVKAHFNVPRLAALSVSQWGEVVAWVLAAAAVRGIILQPIAHVPDAPALADPKAVTDGIIEKIAQGRGGLFTQPTGSAALATMPDDIPWDD